MNDHGSLRILCICDDDAVRFSREPELRQAGYELTWLPSNADLKASGIHCFDVAIICHTVSWRRAASLTAFFRRVNPRIEVLRVDTLRSEMENGFEINCKLISGMGVLIQILDSLSKRQPRYIASPRNHWAFNPS